jgi:hypothetical protein
MSKVQVIKLPTASLMVYDRVSMSTRNEAFSGPTAVVEKLRTSGQVALWGPANDYPQRVIRDKQETSIIANIIDLKVKMLVSGGLCYGTRETDQRTGLSTLKPLQIRDIDYWLEDSAANLYNYEATRDFYNYATCFPEIQMGKGKNYVTGISAFDASHVRLGVMTGKGEINTAYVADWNSGAGEADGITMTAVDPYRQPVQQMLDMGKSRYVVPLRFLGDGQFYYGMPSWNGLRANGWLDVAKRIPELKKQLLQNLMHLNYHIEVDERYWPLKFSNWNKLNDAQKLQLMTEETQAINDWLRSGKGQGGSWMSSIVGSTAGKGQESLVKISDKKGGAMEGMYIEDSQEADFVICRDSGVPPQLFGISPSKSGASAGSGSADRILRTNYILDQKPDADLLLSPYYYASRINGWNDKYGNGQRLTWWFANYYAATLDRTMQVGDMNKPVINNGN